MSIPVVSVIIAAYNAMPYITRCITSTAEQSIGQEFLEVIAVNDGSTDGTAEELDRLVMAHPGLLNVIHQANSGGPSIPRNIGLDNARGQFVFFLDADDYLGPEALERMVSAARSNATDVVLGKTVGVGGREAPVSMFRQNQPKTDVYSSRVYWTLNPMKLFRRDLLERHDLRFPTDLSIGEDQLFVGPAYIHSAGISVVADYDCLYWVQREDEGNITLRTGGTEPRLKFLPRMVDVLLENVPPGPGRDHLAHRHLTVDVQQLLGHLALEERPEQEKALTRLAEIIAPLWHEGLNDRLSAMARLRLHLVRHRMLDDVLELLRFEAELARSDAATPVLVDDGRALARYPFLRDPVRAIPDNCYDVTAQLGIRHRITRAELAASTLRLAGHGYLHRVETRQVSTDLILRERKSGTEFRVPGTHTATPGLGSDHDAGRFAYDRAGFEAVVDVTTAADGKPLPDGLWDISLRVGAQGISKEVRVGSKRAEDVSGAACTHIIATDESLRAVTLYTTNPHGNFTLDIGEKKHAVRSQLHLDAVRCAVDGVAGLEFSGLSSLVVGPANTLAVVLENERGDRAAFPATPIHEDGTFTVRVAPAELPAGVWRGELRLGAWSWPLPKLPKSTVPVKWRRRGLPWYAKSHTADGDFALEVARTSLVKAVARRLKA
ncbi:glycosyl transferase family protein [Streptomyces zinciresistens K42]|uniref:Glycosyl transferase family protein n=1 Tax=Streptomyces zinciresistens K42 TaxID=700597 RepID=G2GA95_9ACTN|nr:glycosyltransferase family 2 protein [Streptomyces zinciresistens]EGX59583.1 glycosyl transferase family protein [Streptomyces zinciresistens K42]